MVIVCLGGMHILPNVLFGILSVCNTFRIFTTNIAVIVTF